MCRPDMNDDRDDDGALLRRRSWRRRADFGALADADPVQAAPVRSGSMARATVDRFWPGAGTRRQVGIPDTRSARR